MEHETTNRRARKSIEPFIGKLLILRNWEFLSTLGAFSHSALYRRCTARTSKGPTICYVKGEAAFGAMQQMLRFFAHSDPHPPSQTRDKVLKAFLRVLKRFDADLLKK
jgi:hypothetical protein